MQVPSGFRNGGPVARRVVPTTIAYPGRRCILFHECNSFLSQSEDLLEGCWFQLAFTFLIFYFGQMRSLDGERPNRLPEMSDILPSFRSGTHLKRL